MDVSQDSCKYLATNVLPEIILPEMYCLEGSCKQIYSLARILQVLHYLARFLKEVCFWANLARFLKEMHFSSTKVSILRLPAFRIFFGYGVKLTK